MSVKPSRADGVTVGYRLATAISYLVNPLILPPIQFALVLGHFGASVSEVQRTTGIGLVFFFLIPLGYVARMVRRGKAATLEIRRQDARTAPFIFGIASYLAGIAALWMTMETARPLLLTLAAIYPVNTAIVAIINLRWKISVHVVSVAGFVVGLLFVMWISHSANTTGLLTVEFVAPLLLLIPLLMWARVRSGAHTTGQVVSGALFGFGMTLAQLLSARGFFWGG